MSDTKKSIREELVFTAANPLRYLVFIDASAYIQRGNGILTHVFKDLGAPKIARWFRALAASDEYKQHAEEFKSLTSRFTGNSTLKVLLAALIKLKSKEVSAEELPAHEKDIMLVLNRIGKYISSKLSEQDSELFDSVTKQLNVIAAIAAKNLNSAIAPAEEPAEEPEADAEKKPEEKPEEKPAEEPADTKDDGGDKEKSSKDDSAEKKDDSNDDEKEKDKQEPETKKEALQKRVTSIVREILRNSIK